VTSKTRRASCIAVVRLRAEVCAAGEDPIKRCIVVRLANDDLA
jgi:hypothetical protein